MPDIGMLLGLRARVAQHWMQDGHSAQNKRLGEGQEKERTSLIPMWFLELSLIVADRCSLPRRRSGESEKGSTKASPMNTSGSSNVSGSDAVSAHRHTRLRIP